MTETNIKKKSSWPAIDAALDEFARNGTLSPSVFAAFADRLRSAIEAPDASRVDEAAKKIEALYRELIDQSSTSVRAASRGVGEADVIAGYALGKVAFAQLLAARVADTRADQRFVEHLRDTRYSPLIRALYGERLNVAALRDRVGERTETVSRKLGALRALGIVVSRKEGNLVVNMLSPAAQVTAEQLGLAIVADENTPSIKAPQVKQTIESKREGLEEHMKKAAHFVARGKISPSSSTLLDRVA